MERLKKLLFGNGFGGNRTAIALPDDVHAALARWRGLPDTVDNQPHYQTRYVVLDITTTGLQVGQDQVRQIAAVAVSGGLIHPDDLLCLELPQANAATGPDEELARQLMGLLEFIGNAPVVAYPVPFVSGFLGPLMTRHLGLDFKPYWLDLALILPELFKEQISAQVSIDDWLHCFGIEAPGRHDAVVDALATARLLQIVLNRAGLRELATPAHLAEIEKARRWLRPGG